MSLKPQYTELVFELQPGIDILSVGAKAANLVKAIEHGFRVPPGFVLTRQALNLFLEQSDLFESAQKLLDHPADLMYAERTEAHRTFCQKLLSTSIPQPLIEAVSPFADALFAETSCGLAVRSSGIYEDSAQASFAGVYESFLGIHSLEGLWTSIRQCWCSSWAPSALDYAKKMGIEPELDGMAVLVQSFLPADSAGVLFTANPRTGNPWQFVLESSCGLARDIVASPGATSVDRFMFEWDTGEMLDCSIALKKTALVPGASGIDHIDLAPDRQDVPSLSDDLAKQIAQAGLRIDRIFNGRVDIEWVVVGDDIHIVQIRPITALPEFFPYHLPVHLADRTWRPAAQWHYLLRKVDGTVTLPIYRDKLITESINRYLQIGPVETPAHRKCGAESDFHGHRYLIEWDDVWPQWPRLPAAQLEQYLFEYEPPMRADFLRHSNTRFPDIEERAVQRENEAKTLEQAIDAILWVLDEMWDFGAFGGGPSQFLGNACQGLLHAYVNEHLANVDVNDLTLGHHPELNPYWPHVMVAEAEEMAKLLGAEGERFEGMSLDELTRLLQAREAPPSFIAALEEYCNRLGLVPPWQFHSRGESPLDLGVRRQTVDFLRLIRKALRGGRRIAQIAEKAARQREAAVAEVREALAAKPDELARFERLHDWALFWGPALNHRILRGNVPNRKLYRLFRKMRELLLAIGLVDDVDDVVYFTVEDLKTIAVTGDIASGRQQLQKRKLDYERSDRLVAPAFLGRAPEEGSISEVHAAPDTNESGAGAETVIVGKPGGPGRSTGIIRRIETLAEGDDCGGEEDVVVLVNPVQSNNNDVPLLFSLLLRVRGIVVPDHPMMWTGHMGQIARECRVPIVLVVPEDLGRLLDGRRIDVDGTLGVLTLLDA